ncbi:MAG: reverse transcriptase domain-containing protein [Thermincolia bacterium]
MSYKPLAVRRSYIPKPGSTKKRPLGIPAYEDKIVQMGVSKILTAIYEKDFLNSSYGFRPGRGCHDALKELNSIIMSKKINWIVDADISGFFDHVDHEWMMKCLAVRIKDNRLLRIITKILKAGVMENGRIRASEEGTPQGGIVSPVLANIYLHYVLDLWFEKVIKKQFKGSAHMVRYADDFVCCFQHEHEVLKARPLPGPKIYTSIFEIKQAPCIDV